MAKQQADECQERHNQRVRFTERQAKEVWALRERYLEMCGQLVNNLKKVNGERSIITLAKSSLTVGNDNCKSHFLYEC